MGNSVGLCDSSLSSQSSYVDSLAFVNIRDAVIKTRRNNMELKRLHFAGDKAVLERERERERVQR